MHNSNKTPWPSVLVPPWIGWVISDQTSNLFRAPFLHVRKGGNSYLEQLPGRLDKAVNAVEGISLISVRPFSSSFALEQHFVALRTFS